MNHEELKAARDERGLTQSKMAELLGVPVSTYRKWEYGDRKIPGPVANQLVGKTLEVKHLSTAQAMEFAKKAHRLGLDPDEVVAKLMMKWLGDTAMILLACIVAWHAFSPHNDHAMRRVGRRKVDGIEGIELMGEA